MGENGWRRYALFTCSQEKNKKEDLLVGIFKESPRFGRMFMIRKRITRRVCTWEIYICNLPTLEISNDESKQ